MENSEKPSKPPAAHILVIEDEESLRYMLETKFNQSGYKVTVAATGKHALQKIRSGKQYDLIICDLKMPVMSGLDVFREYLGLGGKSPFVLLTGHPDKSKIVEAIQMGVRDVILKPIKHLDLLDRVKGFLSS